MPHVFLLALILFWGGGGGVSAVRMYDQVTKHSQYAHVSRRVNFLSHYLQMSVPKWEPCFLFPKKQKFSPTVSFGGGGV